MSIKYLKLFRFTRAAFVLVLLFVSFNSCENDDDDKVEGVVCNPETVDVSIQMIKISSKCSDLDVPYNLLFGAEFRFRLDPICDVSCGKKRLAYTLTTSYSRNFRGTFIETAYMNCAWDSNLRELEFDPVEILETSTRPLELGDTITFHFDNPRFCVEDDYSGCVEEVALDLPEFTFKYVTVEDDFDCD